MFSGGRSWGVAGGPSRRGLVTRAVIAPSDAIMPRMPQTPREDSILYEAHVRGFTAHPSSGVRHPGTFSGLIEKLPYLQALGVTAVELLPIMSSTNLNAVLSAR